jgi:hypothetical protein
MSGFLPAPRVTPKDWSAAIRGLSGLTGNKLLRFAEVSANSARAAERGEGRDRVFRISLVTSALVSDN